MKVAAMDKASAVPGTHGELALPRLYAWRELSIAGLFLMDLAWIVPWFHILVGTTSSAQPGLIFLVLSAVMVGAHLLVRLMNYLRLRLPVRRVFMGLFFVLSVLTVLGNLLYTEQTLSLVELILRPVRAFADLSDLVPIEFVVILVVIFTAWRGMSLAQDYIGPLRVIGVFRLGFLMFLLYVVFITLVTGSVPVLMWSLFLFAGLFAIGTARISVLRLLRGGQPVSFNRGWLIGLVLAISGTILGAAIIAEVTGGIAPVVIGILLRLAIALLVLLIAPFVLVIVLGLTWLLDRLKLEDLGLFESLSLGLTRISDLISSIAEEAGDYSWVLAALLETWQRWGPILRLAVCGSFLVGLGALIISRVRIRARRAGGSFGDEGRDLLGTEGLLNILQANMLDRLHGLTGIFSGRERNVSGYLAAARIRRIYASLMDLSADLAHPRRVAQTPLEYQKTLEKLYLGLEAQIDSLTRAYIRVRYGELPESQSELDEIEAAWGLVEALGKAKRSQLKKHRRR